MNETGDVSGVSIEEAALCDAVALVRLINLAYRVEDFFKAVDRTSLAEVRACFEREQFLVARDSEDELLGCIRFSAAPPEGHFGMLAVHPDAQGRGIARRLIESVEARCCQAGCRSLTLEVASPRTELLPLYQRFGFRVAGTRPWPDHALHELKQPAHFIVMSKSLTQPPAEGTHG
ncbi:GNAT family N-acetyltransferase [Tepidiforma thermophila]|uniref:Ribosomal protein S18 acetylase RimI-like enzyme n=1 Tax=Tepidiforma thermophila (strain KCTC 52669 / CGMCC 1.13589 / G233) TaxID=2761530 RepID=A0A2A9HIC1_TEPT2|nr:GNAT family N-acetyltransferase [Tepidiforma thermophila]PFG74765.1 ribosomal protein S18 acetylase RimI-like enzyme [Tepidiforma thermophila]